MCVPSPPRMPHAQSSIPWCRARTPGSSPQPRTGTPKSPWSPGGAVLQLADCPCWGLVPSRFWGGSRSSPPPITPTALGHRIPLDGSSFLTASPSSCPSRCPQRPGPARGASPNPARGPRSCPALARGATPHQGPPGWFWGWIFPFPFIVGSPLELACVCVRRFLISAVCDVTAVSRSPSPPLLLRGISDSLRFCTAGHFNKFF